MSASEGLVINQHFTRAWRRCFHRFSLAIGLLVAAGLHAPLMLAQTPPPNDNFINASPIGPTNTTVVGSNDYATKEAGEPNHAGNSGGKSVWWTWQAPATGYATLSTRGSTSSFYIYPLDTLLAVYVGSSVSTLTEVASNDEDPATYCTSRVGFKTSAGTLYWIAVDGYGYEDIPDDADSGTIQLTLSLSGLATNDNFADAIQFAGTNVSVTGSNDSATKEPGEPNHAWYSGGKSVWWSWQAPATGYVTLSTGGSMSSQSGTALDALLAVYVGNSVSNLTSVAAQSGTGAGVTFRVEAGTIYRIAVDGYSYWTDSVPDSGSIKLSLSFSTAQPLAPAWGPIPDIYGNEVKSTDFSGKVLLLNFWATWCSYCVAEIPDLEALYEKYAPDGLVIVGVSMDASEDGVNPPTSLISAFASSHSMSYPVLTDRPSWRAIESYFGGIPAIPVTFVIDRQNHICQKFVGSQSYFTFEQAVLPLLYAQPTLKLTLSGGQTRISWPITQATLVPESTDSLAAGIWTPVAVSVQSDGINRFVDLPTGSGQQFFRLRGQ